jgi:acetyl-CoA carboxylase biotin carboxyl carrier protein
MTIDEIRELIALANESGVGELEVQRGGDRVRIRRAGFAAPQEFVMGPIGSATAGPSLTAPSPAAHSQPVPSPVAPSQPVPFQPAAAQAAHEPPAKPSGPDPNLILVKSPIVGTFYESGSPGAEPFVRVGERIQPGKVLCIIESMKLMNEIESETSGIVESKLVTNGQPVEYGEALFAIRAV